jgi:hypothetical protein
MALEQPEAGRGRFSPVDRYGMALALVVVSYLVALLVPARQAGTAGLVIVQLGTVYLVLSVSASRRGQKVAGIALLVTALAAVGMGVAGATLADDNLLVVLYFVNIGLYALAPVIILRHVFRRRVVDGQTFFAAVSAYCMIGMLFAFVYRALGVEGTTFFGRTGADSMPNFLFFSFITVTTTGYGNLVPASTTGQSLAVLEAVAGQFFIAAVVAKIVTAWRPRWAPQRGEWDYEEHRAQEHCAQQHGDQG